ncbi:MAG: M20/M25/M40 family metallo-hydrolase [Dehalobacterium sp.]
MLDKHKLISIADSYLERTVKLAGEMINIPSQSGDEGKLAEFVRQVLLEEQFDKVYRDELGNIIGHIKGHGGPSIMFNCHLDTVGPGDLEAWKRDPWTSTVDNGILYGLGASDTKGAFACQIMAASALKKNDILPDGDIVVVGVVHEESSGLGSRFLAKNLYTDSVIIGEATNNQINIGHRGRMQFDIYLTGKSAHASAPERGVNPHYVAAAIILGIQKFPMRSDSFFGTSSVAPTLYTIDQRNSNTTPGQVVLSLDWRNIPSESEEEIFQRIESLVESCLIPGVDARIEIKTHDLICYTGYKANAPAGEPSFSTPYDDPTVLKAQRVLEDVFNSKVQIGVAQFATDGGHFRSLGSKVIIFSPSEERFCHTPNDCVAIDKMRDALLGNMALALSLGSKSGI